MRTWTLWCKTPASSSGQASPVLGFFAFFGFELLCPSSWVPSSFRKPWQSATFLENQLVKTYRLRQGCTGKPGGGPFSGPRDPPGSFRKPLLTSLWKRKNDTPHGPLKMVHLTWTSPHTKQHIFPTGSTSGNFSSPLRWTPPMGLDPLATAKLVPPPPSRVLARRAEHRSFFQNLQF